MPQRYFTPEQANEALPQVRPVVERMAGHAGALAPARRRHLELVSLVAGNGGGIPAAELADVAAAVEREEAGLARCIGELAGMGVLVKDFERGLVDFPARRGGEDVLLCWHLGEDEVGYWHATDEGYAGRRPLPLD